MSPPDPLKPLDSTRLAFRAVRLPADLPVFTSLAANQPGHINSSTANIRLPGPAHAEKFAKFLAEESFLGAVIWLKPEYTHVHNNGDAPPNNDADSKKDVQDRGGLAIGEIHLSAPAAGTAHHRATELGLDVLPEYQGNGYGTEAIRWVLDYAFRRAGLHRMRVRALGWNEGAMRLYKRMGFTEEGREREAMWHEGRWWDVVEFGMLEGEWWAMQREGGGE